ncbi:hypothetical protein KY366_00310 [Candidatus Woesearchaeota archaeon]|nr:hypothetical protein [Candidatus Woesearchaeota archaeon]
MSSSLTITSVENLQSRISSELRSMKDIPGIYVSLNKTQKSTERILGNSGVNTDKLFFIDCVTSEKKRDDVLHIAPDQLGLLCSAIRAFMNDIKGKKFLVLDALSTLLIYNNENQVVQFVREITEYVSENSSRVIAFSPETKGEELLGQIANFFDEVRRK